MKKKIPGKVIISKGAIVKPHEHITALALIKTGHNVIFLPIAYNGKSPDIKFMKLIWEIKSPKGKSSRTIENNMRTALKQSKNIIIDLHRIQLPEEKCIREIKRQDKLIRGKHRTIITTKSDEVIYLFKNSH